MDAKSSPTTIAEYVAGYPPEVQTRLNEMAEAIRSALRAAGVEFGEEINYGVPTFTLKGKKVVHFGAAKKHVGYYPTPSGVEHFSAEFSKYGGAKGSVQFLNSEPLPVDLVGRVAVWRAEQIKAKG